MKAGPLVRAWLGPSGLGAPSFPRIEDYRAAAPQWSDGARPYSGKPRVTLVTSTFNSQATLQRTFDSVRALQDDDLEYLVVDGGSKDSTLDIIESNLDIISRYTSAPDRGMYDSFNKGVAFARGEFVRIVNSDDLIPPQAVAVALQALGKPDSPTCLRGRIAIIDEHDHVLFDVGNERRNPLYPPDFPILHPSWFVSRELYEQAGLYAVRYKIAGDTEFYHRIIRANFRLQYLDEVLALFRQGGLSDGLRSLSETVEIDTRYLGRSRSAGCLAYYLATNGRRRLLLQTLGKERLMRLRKRVYG